MGKLIGILGFLTASFAAFFVLLVLAYRVAMSDAYVLYCRDALALNVPYSWVRFFLTYQIHPWRSRERFGEITFIRYLLITFLTLTPLAYVASTFL
jgi:hypothetical protein